MVTADFDGKFTVSYTVDGEESAFRALPEAGRLFAAAPDLLAALEGTLSWLTSYPGHGADKAYDVARAAIAKAEGR